MLQNKHFKYDVGCYNQLIEAYGKVSKVREAEKTFKSMKNSNCVPTEGTYNALLNVYSKADMLEKAEALFYDMQQRGYMLGKVSTDSIEHHVKLIVCLHRGQKVHRNNCVTSAVRKCRSSVLVRYNYVIVTCYGCLFSRSDHI